MTSRFLLANLAAVALCTGATAQFGNAQLNMDAPATPKSYVLFAAEPQAIAANKQVALEIRFQVMQGFHINSHTPKSKFLIPTTLSLQPATGVKSGPPEFPAGQLYSFAFDPNEKVDVYAGSFTVMLPVMATAGEHTIDATLKYQACDNASCYPPKTLPVKVLFTAK
jgi:DsbC/DsbD-like thiol-disulfide interchange protein